MSFDPLQQPADINHQLLSLDVFLHMPRCSAGVCIFSATLACASRLLKTVTSSIVHEAAMCCPTSLA